jgi:hypothetical protein
MFHSGSLPDTSVERYGASLTIADRFLPVDEATMSHAAPSFSRRLAAEAVGTALLLATVVGSGIMGESLAGGNVAIALLANVMFEKPAVFLSQHVRAGGLLVHAIDVLRQPGRDHRPCVNGYLRGHPAD